VADVLRSDPGVSLIIEGHTDATGGYQRNMVLSWERATAVYRALVENFGIDPSRLQPIGKGPSEPMPGTAPTDGSNRRVQFRLNG
jgi:outer membrane protein OmpA-like peptidoglycan-associated protein